MLTVKTDHGDFVLDTPAETSRCTLARGRAYRLASLSSASTPSAESGHDRAAARTSAM